MAVRAAFLSQPMTVTGVEANPLEMAVRQHARLVYGIAYSVLQNHHDAEDATQETFLKVVRYGGKLARVDDQRNWVARIAWRVAIDRRRGLRIATADAGSDEIEMLRSSVAGADEVVLGTELGRLLQKVIHSLPEKLRKPLILSTVKEMSPADIAAVLGINEAAVRSRLFRARQAIKEKLSVLLEGRHAI